MRRSWLFLAVAVGLVAQSAGPLRAEEKLNKPPKGYKALFNGKDLKNWQGLIELPKRNELSPDQRQERQAAADKKMLEHWSVKDGILVFDGKGDSLQTAKDYGNFELYVDWKVHAAGDSGIYLRGNPQVQIWEKTAGSAIDANGKFIGSGGLFNNQKNPSKPIAVADKPAGEWNTFWIRMVGDRVTVKLNDILVVDNTPLENYWKRGEPLPAKGPIELQNHGNELQFRNIYIRELPDDLTAEDAAPKVAKNDEPEGELPQAGLITLSIEKAPLTQVIQIMAQTANVEIILSDPEGKLAEKQMSFLNIKDKTFEKALDLVCKSAGLTYTKDNTGVYVISPKS